MKREDLLDLNEALQYPGKKLHFAVSTELTSEEDLDLLQPVSGELEAVSTGNLLLLKGSFKTRAVVECARCAGPLEMELEFEMADEFMVDGIPSSWSREGYAKVAPDEEPEPLFAENRLYRDRYVRQGLLLNLPMQPLCSGGWDKPCPLGRGDRFDPEPDSPEAHEPSEGPHPSLQGLSKLMRREEE